MGIIKDTEKYLLRMYKKRESCNNPKELKSIDEKIKFWEEYIAERKRYYQKRILEEEGVFYKYERIQLKDGRNGYVDDVSESKLLVRVDDGSYSWPVVVVPKSEAKLIYEE